MTLAFNSLTNTPVPGPAGDANCGSISYFSGGSLERIGMAGGGAELIDGSIRGDRMDWGFVIEK